MKDDSILLIDSLTDLTVEAFLILRDAFFNKDGSPKTFPLRAKGKTQSDPLDVYIANILSQQLTDAKCKPSPGPNTNPDMVVLREEECNQVPPESLKKDVTRIVAIEVKKLERSAQGKGARATGMDYNSTPPCGTVRVYYNKNIPVEIRGFYLVVYQEWDINGNAFLSALTLCDGDALNTDFTLYEEITGQRKKGIGLGSYGDGANRIRPMLLFANPLGAKELDRSITLITQHNLLGYSRISMVYEIIRTTMEGEQNTFYVYREKGDIPDDWQVSLLVDPFPQPEKRGTATQQRGMFRLPIYPKVKNNTLW
jgi:hypothetical protein